MRVMWRQRGCQGKGFGKVEMMGFGKNRDQRRSKWGTRQEGGGAGGLHPRMKSDGNNPSVE